MDKLREIVEKMEPISLKEMDRVSLMNRTDTKFYLHEKYLPHILSTIQNNYFVLEIEAERIMPYESHYYDTPTFTMYHWHHSGKSNRFKVRRRQYLLTGEMYLEVKFKNNKGKTLKKRELDGKKGDEGQFFVEKNTPFKHEDLQYILSNRFLRIMLINKHINERISIDLNLSYHKLQSETINIPHLAIIEIKSELHAENSEMQRTLKGLQIYPQSFSKFVTGCHLFYKNLRFNRFKGRFLKINKLINQEIL